MRIDSDPPLFPTGKIIASVVPTALVDLNVSVEPTAVPPINNGVVKLVVSVGLARHAGATPAPPDVITCPVTVRTNLANVLAVSAYSISPIVYVENPVPPYPAVHGICDTICACTD